MDCSLKDLFPYLFRLTTEKGASITMNLARYMGLEFSIDSTFSRLGIRVCGVFFFFFFLFFVGRKVYITKKEDN